MRTSDFDYPLPEDLIAQQASPDRASSRLLVLDRRLPELTEATVAALPSLLRPGDLLVLNNSRVFPARWRGTKADGGGQIEILLLEAAPEACWRAMLRPGKRVRPGTRLILGRPPSTVPAEVLAKDPDGIVVLRFPAGTDVLAESERHGEVPLPPYIRRDHPDAADRERYQTVYARHPGSVAAPTAGLHLSLDLLAALRAAGVETCEVTLHVGAGTFAPVKGEDLDAHVMHEECYEIAAETADRIEAARQEGRRVIAVGTTSLRVLESAARRDSGRIVPHQGRTRLFLRPPADFRVVDALLTNFHLPRSTLLMLVCAFASPGSEAGCVRMLEAYREAVARRFRFFSYGDAMLIL